jgi:tRNA G26 N,N-dimethylase Trm1
METNSRQKRIKISKHFFFNLTQIENKIQSKTESIEKLINSSAPAGYRNNLRFQNTKIQETKKNYSIEATFGDVEEINKLKSDKEKLLKQYKYNSDLIDKVDDFYYRMFLQCLFIFKLSKNEIKKILRAKQIKTNNDFDNFLNESLISFSYILENEYKKLKEA